MNKILLISLPVLVLLIVGGLILLKPSQKVSNKETSPVVTNTPSQVVTKETEIPGGMPTSRYLDFTSTSLIDQADKSRILYFYANWCPTCRPVDVELQKRMDEIPSGTVIIRVNYDDTDTDSDEETLSKKYNVTYQHTFVLIDQDGNEIKKWNGGGLDKILSEI